LSTDSQVTTTISTSKAVVMLKIFRLMGSRMGSPGEPTD
jgi:hypothetical protein